LKHPAETSLRLLVIDDDEETADAVRTVLAHWGHEVWTAPDGATGLDLAARFRPDVILLDLSLPDVDGFQVAQRIREWPGGPGPVLIAATGYAGRSVRLAAREVGFDHFLPKPFDLAQLRAILAAGRLGPEAHRVPVEMDRPR
jgi:two-component system, chemotaxis family, CheB/CheR fusion protein